LLAKRSKPLFRSRKNALCRSFRHVYGALRDTSSALAHNGERIFTKREKGRSYLCCSAFALLRKFSPRRVFPSEIFL